MVLEEEMVATPSSLNDRNRDKNKEPLEIFEVRRNFDIDFSEEPSIQYLEQVALSEEILGLILKS